MQLFVLNCKQSLLQVLINDNGNNVLFLIYRIEHLYLDVLDSLPNNVFEFIKPKLAVFTTPNVEFNILFTNFTTQFRHDDHKFEWTRKQFKEW